MLGSAAIAIQPQLGGEFYELLGEDSQSLAPMDWHQLAPLEAQKRHFLFYLRDSTFECFAAEWRFHKGV